MWLQPSSAAIRRTPQPSTLRRTIAATSSGALIVSPCGCTIRRETSPFEPTIRTLRLRGSSSSCRHQSSFSCRPNTIDAPERLRLDGLRCVLAELPEAVHSGEHKAAVVGDRNEVYQ